MESKRRPGSWAALAAAGCGMERAAEKARTAGRLGLPAERQRPGRLAPWRLGASPVRRGVRDDAVLRRQNYEQDYLDKQEYLLLHFLFIHADFGQFL